MFDYEMLRLIWWLLLGVLLTGFAIMDGFDLGVAVLLPWVARNDEQRRITLNTVGPVWEGNQVWLILGAGAIFAAWPMAYGIAFSCFYFAMLLVLAALIIRPVGFKYRSKLNNPTWRTFWDYGLFVSGLVPSIIFGVAIGNVLQGIPFHFDSDLRIFYDGTFWQLLNPFALLCGITSLAMLCQQGGLFLANKTEGAIQCRAITASRIGGLLLILGFAAGGFYIAYGINGFQLDQAVAHDGPSNPLNFPISQQVGAWLNNYQSYPLTRVVPALGFAGALFAILLARRAKKLAMIMSSLGIIGVIASVGVSMFPFLLPSTAEVKASLT